MAQVLPEPGELLLEAARRLHSVGPVVGIDAKRLLIVGDTHGYPEVSEWALGAGEELGVELTVFLGDYVDRGPRGVENIEMLAGRLVEGWKLLLLRGNHESLLMNSYYGFAEEAREKRGREYLRVVEEFYRSLPILALVEGGVLLVHGGIPCRLCRNKPEDPVRLGEMEERLRGLWGTPEIDEPSDPLAMQLLWNDPRGSIEWFLPSPRGPGIYLYGRSAWKRFMEENSLRLIVRAHETVDAVEAWRPDGSLLAGLRHGEKLGLEELRYSVVTVFSSMYHGRGAGALLLDMGEEAAVVLRYPEKPP